MPKKFDMKETALAAFFAVYYIALDCLFYKNNVFALILVIIGGIAVFCFGMRRTIFSSS